MYTENKKSNKKQAQPEVKKTNRGNGRPDRPSKLKRKAERAERFGTKSAE
jgi:hypothetical protein